MALPFVLITGGSGLIGRALTSSLLSEGYRVAVLTRRPDRYRRRPGENVELYSQLGNIPEEVPISVVVNLAGARIVGARWSEGRKRILRESRIALTESLVEWMLGRTHLPSALISGSAVGYYGDTGDAVVDEETRCGEDFGAVLCRDWEAATEPAVIGGVRVVCLRTGLVLSREGGMLPPMSNSFRLGLGAQLGNGRQWMSWIHIDDHIGAVRHLISSQESAGAYNLTAPAPVTNRDFSDSLARALRRPRIFTAPSSVLRILLGESAELLLGGQRALPSRLQREGFAFHYSNISVALQNLFAGR